MPNTIGFQPLIGFLGPILSQPLVGLSNQRLEGLEADAILKSNQRLEASATSNNQRLEASASWRLALRNFLVRRESAACRLVRIPTTALNDDG